VSAPLLPCPFCGNDDPSRLTTAQLFAAVERDTDPVSVFGDGTCQQDTDRAILVIKGADSISRVLALLVRQGLLTEGKSVEGDAP